MSARRHGQGLGHFPNENVEKCFFGCECCQKNLVDEVFMHYVENMSSASGALPPDAHRVAAPGPSWGTSILQTPSLPIPGQNPASAHGDL